MTDPILFSVQFEGETILLGECGYVLAKGDLIQIGDNRYRVREVLWCFNLPTHDINVTLFVEKQSEFASER